MSIVRNSNRLFSIDKKEKNTALFKEEYSILLALSRCEEDETSQEDDYPAFTTPPEYSKKMMLNALKKLNRNEGKTKAHTPAKELIAHFDPDVKDGEIRLLSQLEKITYAAVLPWSKTHVLLIPFSHMSHPATDMEMSAYARIAKPGFQKVFQIWNARTANIEIVRRSWVSGFITDQERKQLYRMLRYCFLGEAFGESEEDIEIQKRIGTPLEKGYDIRKQYMRQELSYFAAFDKEDAMLDQKQKQSKASSVPTKAITFPIPNDLLPEIAKIAAKSIGRTYRRNKARGAIKKQSQQKNEKFVWVLKHDGKGNVIVTPELESEVINNSKFHKIESMGRVACSPPKDSIGVQTEAKYSMLNAQKTKSSGRKKKSINIDLNRFGKN